MKKTNAGKLTVFAAAALSVAMLLGACGGTTATTADKAKGGMTEEPAAGVDTSYAGALPMPKVDKRYDNPQPRDNVK
ncbi:hypothetical protein CG405_07775, partial [Gardnerella vaginalis]